MDEQVDLDELVAVSRRYGGDSSLVLAGGGNTSLKTAAWLLVKASGHALATINAGGFVALDRGRLAAMLDAEYPAEAAGRERVFVERVMGARVKADGGRPSVEALIHHLLPRRLVVHTHPTLVNAVTCCEQGERLVREWYGGRVLWQHYVDPGLTLARALRENLCAFGGQPMAIFLENHGLIVSGETAEEIEAATAAVLEPIEKRVTWTSLPADDGEGDLEELEAAICRLRPDVQTHCDLSTPIDRLVRTPKLLAAALAGALTPDHIVYCRSVPVWVKEPGELPAAWAAYEAEHGFEPWVVLSPNGMVAARATYELAETTADLFVDAAKILYLADSLGGVRLMSPGHRRFIETWEVEAYRRAVAAG
jgi:rhamnose utilization protein RhaD (predicted bifunctional aldolase and dehydrogenase)